MKRNIQEKGLLRRTSLVYELGLFKDCPRRDDWSSRSSLFLSVFCGITLCHRKSFHSTVWQLPLLVERRLVALLLFVQSFPLRKSQSLFLQTKTSFLCPLAFISKGKKGQLGLWLWFASTRQNPKHNEQDLFFQGYNKRGFKFESSSLYA